jgi:hypothetical protein
MIYEIEKIMIKFFKRLRYLITRKHKNDYIKSKVRNEMHLKAQKKISRQVKVFAQVQVFKKVPGYGNLCLEDQLKSIPNESVLLQVLVSLNSIKK